MANSDGRIRIIIDTNAEAAAKTLDKTSKAFDNTGKSAKTVSSVFNGLQNKVNENVDILKELALAGATGSQEFKRLSASVRETQKMLDNATKAVDKATGGLSKQNNGMQNLIGTAKGLIAGYIGIQGAIKVFNFALESVEAYRTQQRAISGLNTALQNAGVYSKEYSQHLQQLASDIQKYSNYGDEAVLKAQSLGQSFIGQTRITDELTKAVVDFAAANEMDLDQAFTLVGKSIGSSTNALGRYGVELKKGMTDSQKMAAITKQLSERYEGQARQMANSSVQLKNAVGDLKETLGSGLPIFERWNEGAIMIIDKFNKWAQSARILKGELQSLSKEEAIIRAQKQMDLMAQYDYNSIGYKQAQYEFHRSMNYINALKMGKTGKGTNKAPIKINDDYGISSAIGTIQGGPANVQNVKDDYEKLQQAVQNAKREIELAAIAHGTSSTEVQNAFVKYNQLNTELSNINSLFDTQTVKVEQQKGAYQLLNDNVSSLTAKLRDLAAENQVGSAEWNNYKTQLQEAKTELDNVNKALTNNGVKLEDYGKQISSSLSSGLVNALRNGGNAFDAFSSLATTALQKILDKLIEMSVITPILNAFTGSTGGTLFGFLGGLFGSANGNVFQNGNVIPFAKGGVVNKPTIFPMANGGTGLMGEAGAEAVMPLRRMSNGRLGVEASSENGKAVQVNIYNQSKSQVETRQRNDGGTDIIIKRVNEALMNERTSSGFRAAYQRENRKGLQAV